MFSCHTARLEQVLTQLFVFLKHPQITIEDCQMAQDSSGITGVVSSLYHAGAVGGNGFLCLVLFGKGFEHTTSFLILSSQAAHFFTSSSKKKPVPSPVTAVPPPVPCRRDFLKPHDGTETGRTCPLPTRRNDGRARHGYGAQPYSVLRLSTHGPATLAFSPRAVHCRNHSRRRDILSNCRIRRKCSPVSSQVEC
jgi:hypothetical protein